MKSLLLLLITLLIASIADVVHADPSVRVYECKVDGQRVFSDHECGIDAVEHDVTVTSRMDAVKASPDNGKSSKSSHRVHQHATGGDESDKRRRQCAKIQTSRESLVNKMRAGYTAKQDERFHERLRKLDDDYFELRCSGVH